MKTLSETIQHLQNIERFNELLEMFHNWNTKFTSPEGIDFNILECSLTEANNNYNYKRKINLKSLKEDYSHYFEMMDNEYPEKRKLNKLVKEYNSLVENYAHLNHEYVCIELNRIVSKMIKND